MSLCGVLRRKEVMFPVSSVRFVKRSRTGWNRTVTLYHVHQVRRRILEPREVGGVFQGLDGTTGRQRWVVGNRRPVSRLFDGASACRVDDQLQLTRLLHG